MTGIRPMTREEVIGALRKTYAKFDALLECFDELQMEELRVHNDWTIKDNLAHLASWENLETGWIEAVIAGKKPLLYTEGYEWDLIDRNLQTELIHGYNAHVLAKCKERSFDDVMSEFRDSQTRLLDAIARLPDNACSIPDVLFCRKLEVPRDPWTPLPVNCHEHYAAHSRWLRGFIKRSIANNASTNV